MEIKYREEGNGINIGIGCFNWLGAMKPYFTDSGKNTLVTQLTDICCNEICEFSINKIFNFKVCPYCGEKIKKVKI